MKQRIIIEIDGDHKNEDGEEVSLPPYELLEKKSEKYSYEALRHFFEDIGYRVTKLELTEATLQSYKVQDTEDLILHYKNPTDEAGGRVVLMIPSGAFGRHELLFTLSQARDLGKELLHMGAEPGPSWWLAPNPDEVSGPMKDWGEASEEDRRWVLEELWKHHSQTVHQTANREEHRRFALMTSALKVLPALRASTSVDEGEELIKATFADTERPSEVLSGRAQKNTDREEAACALMEICQALQEYKKLPGADPAKVEQVGKIIEGLATDLEKSAK